MTGPEHYREAERLVGLVEPGGAADWESIVAAAQVHATLALAAATALGVAQEASPLDKRAWVEAAATKVSP